MWERFSYYGMRALLVYYMIKELAFTQGHASQIYGLYTGLVYLTPLFGGILADRKLGQRKTVILGAVLMALGHFMMAFEFLFFPALLLLILGNGAFKPNISTQVGSLYPPGDPRRDRAFSIFYVGINLGAFFSPLICGTLGERWGWHYGFSAAGIGMVVGLLIYLMGARWLAADVIAQTVPDLKRADQVLDAEEKNRIFALIAMCVISIAFWTVYEQQGNTLALWADANTDRYIFGWEFPASWFQALNPAFVFTCTPIITTIWAWQSRKHKEPSAISKMAIGCLLLSLGFILMSPAAQVYAASGTPVSILWLVAFTLLVTLGELYLSPVGLSLVTKLAPARMASMMMGIWFLSSFLGNGAAGLLGNYWDKIPKDAFFLVMALIAFAACAFILVIRKPLRRAVGPDESI
jgi:POT family proton-dependent oligopeptide transporter